MPMAKRVDLPVQLELAKRLNGIAPRHPHLAWSSACCEGLPLVAAVAANQVKNDRMP